jgi:hypothetical protein
MSKVQIRWTNWKVQHLKKTYKTHETENLRELFGTTPRAVRRKAQILGVLKKPWKRWTAEECEALLRLGYPITNQVARQFGRSSGSMLAKLRELNAKKASSQTP